MARSLLLFGATGLSGRRTLEQALERGHKVTAIARNPESLSDVQHENLTVVAGNALDKNTFKEAMQGKDAVISCLGGKVPLYGSVDIYSVSAKEIHQAMLECGVSRAVFMSSWGSKHTDNVPWYFRLFMFFIRGLLSDIAVMEDYLQESAQDIKYTVVRPPGLTNKPRTDSPFVVREDVHFIVGIPAEIPRADVARFLLDCLETSEYDRKMVTIGIDTEQAQS